MHRNELFRRVALAVLLGLASLVASGQVAPAPHQQSSNQPLLILGSGDELKMHIFGQPNMDGTMYVADDGTIQVPLAGAVHVAGLSPIEAAHAVESALRKGQFLIDPHVTFTIILSRSQRVSVLGQVHSPGIYNVQSNTTVIDILAQAGGETEQGADTIYILRSDGAGTIHRLVVDLQGLGSTRTAPTAAEITLKGGDQVYVPRAPQFFITGAVHQPGRFRLEPGMTVLEALARAGGVTQMGSTRRVIIRRADGKGQYRNVAARLADKVQPDDVITVRERVF